MDGPCAAHEALAQCLIDNANWANAFEEGVGIDEDTYATRRAAYGHLLGEMPHERAVFDPEQLMYWVRVQLATPRWMKQARENGFR